MDFQILSPIASRLLEDMLASIAVPRSIRSIDGSIQLKHRNWNRLIDEPGLDRQRKGRSRCPLCSVSSSALSTGRSVTATIERCTSRSEVVPESIGAEGADVNQESELVTAWRQRRAPAAPADSAAPAHSAALAQGDGDAEELSDAMLLAGFAASDPRASLLFVRRFERRAIGIATAVVHDQGLAEDIAQQAFERAWAHADSYDPCRGSVRAWMNTIVRNLAVDMMRVRRPFPLRAEELEPLITAMTSTPEGHALDSEASAILRHTLTALPAEQARAVVLAAVHGYSASQVAKLESIPVGTAKSRIRCGLIKLREAVVNPNHRGQNRLRPRSPLG